MAVAEAVPRWWADRNTPGWAGSGQAEPGGRAESFAEGHVPYRPIHSHIPE